MMHTELFGLGRARSYLYSLCHHLIYVSSRFHFKRLLRLRGSLARHIYIPFYITDILV